MSARRKLMALLVPWLFLAMFGALYALLVFPRVRDGQLLAWFLSAFLVLVAVSFGAAAITFSRDVVNGRWPE